MSEIRLEGVSKVYAGDVRAVDDVSLTIGSGEFMVLVGPSGCGESTLLRMIAGLEEVSGGEIWIGEREVSRLAPRDRDIAIVFRTTRSTPTSPSSATSAMAQGAKDAQGRRRPAGRRGGTQMLGLEALLHQRPGALSGGQRQRVAMGRAIVREPAAFPDGRAALEFDAKLRVDMRAQLARLHERSR